MLKNRKINISGIFLMAVLITILIYFIVLKEKESKQRIALQERLNNVLKEKIIKEEELNKVNLEKISLEETVDNLKTKIESLTMELDREKDTTTELSGRLKDREKEIEKLKGELNKLNKEKESLELKIKEAEEKIKKLEATIVELQTVKTELEQKLDSIMSKRLEVELEKVVVKRPSLSIPGRVLAVNHPYEFVVISLGKEQGIETGMTLGIYRGKERIAKIKIEKVYDNMSVADIIYEKEKGIIREDDVVKIVSSEGEE